MAMDTAAHVDHLGKNIGRIRLIRVAGTVRVHHGECGTDRKLDNCSNDKDQGADIYRIVGSTPNYQPTRKPTGGSSDCVDDESWCYGDCSPNDCAYVGQKVKPDGTLARCKEKNTDGERSALEACPATCGTCP